MEEGGREENKMGNVLKAMEEKKGGTKIREMTGNLFNRTDEVLKDQERRLKKCKNLCEANFTTFTTSTESLDAAKLMGSLGATDLEDTNER